MTNSEGTHRAAAVVLAGGSGERFGGPKFRATFLSRSLLDWAVDLVRELCDPVVVTLPEGEVWNGPDGVDVVVGGSSRAESLENGLDAVGQLASVVVIHDVIRPLATVSQVISVIEAVEQGADAATMAWTPPDTVKKVDRPSGLVKHLGRQDLRIAHGPTAARVATLRRAIERLGNLGVEETVGVEKIGGLVRTVDGDPWSHHIVTPQDLMLAELVALHRSDGNN